MLTIPLTFFIAVVTLISTLLMLTTSTAQLFPLNAVEVCPGTITQVVSADPCRTALTLSMRGDNAALCHHDPALLPNGGIGIPPLHSQYLGRETRAVFCTTPDWGVCGRVSSYEIIAPWCGRRR